MRQLWRSISIHEKAIEIRFVTGFYESSFFAILQFIVDISRFWIGTIWRYAEKYNSFRTWRSFLDPLFLIFYLSCGTLDECKFLSITIGAQKSISWNTFVVCQSCRSERFGKSERKQLFDSPIVFIIYGTYNVKSFNSWSRKNIYIP